ncbi:DUF218 domain-domain-containing protein [Kockovaella imperatae]|uniref:DUF218 domain-domain-containing protein n=1 Tax=Kockovaella imperatae TaxID=4999 RepID=A0A1Y1UL44_9TREE|nr:DUF218 domain-domain-containing protein [Kockovaella imperatae]ORX38709.1 DUF218 domain-domain-containing protein [Kockovaella imperatae]
MSLRHSFKDDPQQMAALHRDALMRYLRQAPTQDVDEALRALAANAEPEPEPLSSGTEPLHLLVVLGVPPRPDGQLTEGLRARVNKAFELAHKYPAAKIVVTGGAVANRYAEAEVMQRELIAWGVDPRRILVENRARITLDNAAYTLALLKRDWPDFCRGSGAEGGRPPARLTVVSEPYHGVRSLRHFAAALKIFNVHVELRYAPARGGSQAMLSDMHKPLRLGDTWLPRPMQAHLERTIEEQRRIVCGW